MKTYVLILLLNLTTVVLFAQPDYYDSLWNDPEIVQNIEYNTEKYRKGDAVVEIISKDGRLATGAIVEVKQQTHEFLFGCNLFVLGQLDSEELNSKYEKAFINLFNFATIPFFWKDLEPEPEKFRFSKNDSFIWRRPAPDPLIDWCYEHNITPKGHCLMYVKNIAMPEWTAKDNPELLMQQAHKHIVEIAERYQDKMPIWDIANEEYKRKRSRSPEYWHEVPDDYLAWCFREANASFPPNVKLIYNEGKHALDAKEEYMDYFCTIMKEGLDVDGMGIHVHFWDEYERNSLLLGKLLPPKKLIGDFDKIGKMNLPIYITEITIPGMGENGNGLQAKIVENMYRLWFSTPNMAGITWWNLGDNTAYGNENNLKGGLLDENMDQKPAYEILDRLINHEWRTNEVLQTDNYGKARFWGFYGKYIIEVKYQGKMVKKEITLRKSGDNHFTIQL